MNHNPFHVGGKKPYELWSTNKKVLDVHTDPLKWTFCERPHFRPYGLMPPQIFTRSRDWPSLASAHVNSDGGLPPQKKCNRENLEFGLKFCVCALITSRLVNPDHVPRGRGDNVGKIFGRPVPKIWEGQKRPNFGAISDNFFRLRSRIFPGWIDI